MTDLMNVDFDLLSIGNKIGEIKVKKYSAEFQVMDNSKYILEGASNIPPVSAIIGAGFLLEHKWVVDFAYGVVCSVKNWQKYKLFLGLILFWRENRKNVVILYRILKHNMYGDSDYSIYRVSACTAYPAFL